MTDDELLDYAKHHSRTPRALFSSEHARRLCVLAGREDKAKTIPVNSFIAIHEDVADELIKLANERKSIAAPCPYWPGCSCPTPAACTRDK